MGTAMYPALAFFLPLDYTPFSATRNNAMARYRFAFQFEMW
jgi:hypothetical protein